MRYPILSPTVKYAFGGREMHFSNFDPFLLDRNGIIHYNIKVIGVWRSLVSRMVRVHEARGSNPLTPTNIKIRTSSGVRIFFVLADFQGFARVEVG